MMDKTNDGWIEADQLYYQDRLRIEDERSRPGMPNATIHAELAAMYREILRRCRADVAGDNQPPIG